VSDLSTAHSRVHARSMLDATDRLIHDFPDAPAGRVIAAMAKAKVQVRDVSAGNGIYPPPTEDYVSLIENLARHELSRFADA
jgi:hypothetical protein